jgi:hypothetical protein
MKFRLLITAVVLGLVSLACTMSIDFPASRTGETKTLTLNEPVPSGSPARVEIAMLGGQLNISGGGDNLVTGQIEYNLAEWEPQVMRSGDTVRVEQEAKTIPIPADEKMVNRWNLQLGDTPMVLNVQAGAYDGAFNLSSVPLVGLEVNGGASNAEVRFDTPNPQAMEDFYYQTGASNVEIYGLGYASPSLFTFKCGAGDYLIDFSGQPQRAITANITGALGNLTIVIPPGASAEVNLTGNLQDVNLEGDWNQAGDRYLTSGSGPLITINVEMSIGQLNLAIR